MILTTGSQFASMVFTEESACHGKFTEHGNGGLLLLSEMSSIQAIVVYNSSKVAPESEFYAAVIGKESWWRIDTLSGLAVDAAENSS